MFFAIPKLYTLMVFDKWQNGIIVDFIVIEKVERALDLDLVL
jgi:hypothetical protein